MNHSKFEKLAKEIDEEVKKELMNYTNDDPYDEITLWVGATEYYLGRMSYTVDSFCNLIVKNWNLLTEPTKILIKRTVEERFERDDFFRKNKENDDRGWFPLGMDCDRESWEKVRNLWKGT